MLTSALLEPKMIRKPYYYYFCFEIIPNYSFDELMLESNILLKDEDGGKVFPNSTIFSYFKPTVTYRRFTNGQF